MFDAVDLSLNFDLNVVSLSYSGDDVNLFPEMFRGDGNDKQPTCGDVVKI